MIGIVGAALLLACLVGLPWLSVVLIGVFVSADGWSLVALIATFYFLGSRTWRWLNKRTIVPEFALYDTYVAPPAQVEVPAKREPEVVLAGGRTSLDEPEEDEEWSGLG